ncbi:RloB family protein [Streptomyces viridosporus]|uniref:RloB domain-containing protein n=1 Tax=Streptomyces viridosporus T7A TaxID=665577 RepID=A0ABX6AJS1_STRVD|nr:RloB family protein [Streptomyces viridosporus]QEU87302.1 RloB domain-containing protein [Streptomyces viridosporus T7A]
MTRSRWRSPGGGRRVARDPKQDGRRNPRRESTLRRRPAYRDALPTILVVCGARNTEPAYIRGLLRVVDNRAVDVRVKVCPQDPVSVVRHAAGERTRARDHYDRTWCVLDVDDFAHLDEALRLARAERIDIALSNPCFELWLLLHFRTHSAPVDGFRQAERHLLPHHRGYSKAADRFTFDLYRETWPQAVERARALARPGEEHKEEPVDRDVATSPGDRPGSSAELTSARTRPLW